jgi:hypothetical protein
MKVLIIEDRKPLADEYIRIFGHLLEGEYSYTHVPTIEAAIGSLETENWDAILVDSELGAPCMFPIGSEEDDGIKINNGYDLVKMRRGIEDSTDGIDRSFIMAIAANRVALTFFQDVGTDAGFLKIEMPDMAQAIKELSK